MMRILDVIGFKLASCAVLVATIVAGALSFAIPKKYEARAALMVLEPLAERGLDPDYRKLEFAIETYSRILKSSDLLLQVILEMNLDLPPANMTVEKLEKLIKVKSVRDSQLIRIELQYSDPTRAAEIVNLLADKFLGFHKALMAGEAESSQEFFRHQLELAQDKLKETDEKLIEFQKEAQLDNLDKRLKVALDKIEEFKKSLAYNRIEYEKAKAEIEQSKATLSGLAKEQITLRSHTISSEPKQSSLKEGLEDLESRLAKVSAQDEEVKALVSKLEYEIMTLKAKLESGRAVSSADLAVLDALISKLPRNILGEVMPDLIEAASNLQKIIVELNPIYQEVERNLVTSQIWMAQVEGERKAMEEALEKAENEYEELNSKIAHLSRESDELWRNQGVYAKAYEELTAKIEQMRIDVAAKIGGVVLVESAIVPSKHVSPNPVRNAAVAFILSALFMGGLLYLRFSYPKDRNELKDNRT